MTAADIEQKVTQLVAEKLGLTINKGICRGPLPETVCDAIGVMIDSAGTGNEPSLSRFSIQLLGRYKSRDEALNLCAKLDEIFPDWAPDYTILKVGSPGIYQTAFKGKKVTGISANLEGFFPG